MAVAAEGACLHVLTDAPHKSKIFAGALKLADALQDLKQVAHAHSARETLAAGLVLAEGDQRPRHIHYTHAVVSGDETAGSDDGARRSQDLEVQENIDIVRAQDSAQWPAGLEKFQGLAVAHAAGRFVDHVFQVHSQRHFHHPGVFQVPRQA